MTRSPHTITALAAALTLALAFAPGAWAQDGHIPPKTQTAIHPVAAAHPAIAAAPHRMAPDIFMGAMARMQNSMAHIRPTGDPDMDFINMMLPHHESAVEMAKMVLATGKDPQIHKLAEDIIAAQDKEIAFMRNWQAKHKTQEPKK